MGNGNLEEANTVEKQPADPVGLQGRTLEVVPGRAEAQVIMDTVVKTDLIPLVIRPRPQVGVGERRQSRIRIHVTVGDPGGIVALAGRSAIRLLLRCLRTRLPDRVRHPGLSLAGRVVDQEPADPIR